MKLTSAEGKEIEVTVVDIERSVERFSHLELGDGTILKIKPSVTHVVRLNEHWDSDGNPVYVAKSQNILVVDKVGKTLKQRGGH